ncbi:membrane protein [gut metagenome]|uniref:Membrane protein n=1 Tax=gut metagenome TaxID=749906 RepID=J9FLB7_9ZZZZ
MSCRSLDFIATTIVTGIQKRKHFLAEVLPLSLKACANGCLLSFSGCFFSRSFSFGSSGSGSSFGLSLSSSGSSLLFCNLLSDLFVNLLLGFEASFNSCLLLSSLLVSSCVSLVFLFLLPSFKLSLSSSFVECAALYTAVEVMHHHNAFARKDVAHGVSQLSTRFNPIKCAFKIQIYCGRIGVRVVRTNLFSKLTITWCSYVCDHDAVEGVALTTVTLQSNFSCHFFV